MFASANIADPRFRTIFHVRPEAVGRFAKTAGYDGVELHPAFDWLASPEAVARAVEEGKLAVNSLHASFRTTRRSQGTNRTNEKPRGLVERAIASPLGRALMPEVVDSSAYMRAVQERIGAKPCVLYPLPDRDLENQALNVGGGLRLLQPTDHVAAMIGARTPEEMVEKLLARGYDGLILDTFHMQPKRYDGGLPQVASDLDRSLPVFQPYVFGAHLSVNRQDTAGGIPDLQASTARDLDNALDGRYDGETGEILTAAWTSPQFEYVAVETTAGQVAERTGHDEPFMLAMDYRRLSDGLRSYSPS